MKYSMEGEAYTHEGFHVHDKLFCQNDGEKEIYQFPISAKTRITSDNGELIFNCQIWPLVLH